MLRYARNMFGRKKQDGPTPAPTAPVTAQQPDVKAETAARIELNKHGSRATATVTAVAGERIGAWHRERVTLLVHPPGGTDYEAVIVHHRFGTTASPVGELRDVVFDEDDQTHVEWLMLDVAPEARWKVPSSCPNCGAPVDQSRASMANHPTCTSCNRPLPCEPAGK